MTARKHDHFYFTEEGKNKGRRHFLMIWNDPIGQREKADSCSRRSRLSKFSQNTNALSYFRWEGFPFRHVGEKGRRGKCSDDILKLFGKNGYFPCDILEPPNVMFPCLLSGCYQRHYSEMREGVTCSSSHTLLPLLVFLKALWPRKEMYGMNDARTAESIERHQSIYTSRKKKMSTGQWLYTPWTGYAKIIWKKQ